MHKKYELDRVDFHNTVDFLQQGLHFEVACIVGRRQSFDMHMTIQIQVRADI